MMNMATGKERGYKDWKLSKAFKRSARNYTESDTITRGAKRKNTRKYCKGVEGRKHVVAGYSRYGYYFTNKCTVCGKEIYRPKTNELEYAEYKPGGYW
jgi:hypothetical protein